MSYHMCCILTRERKEENIKDSVVTGRDERCDAVSIVQQVPIGKSVLNNVNIKL